MTGTPPRAPSSEDDFIATFFKPLAGPGALALDDDAACIQPPPGTDLVVTADALVAGVHFFADDPPAAIAQKALRVNLSDLAAKGADPIGYLLTLALPDGGKADFVGAFAEGLRDDAAFYACPLLGGDTVRTPGPLTLSITALGSVPCGRMARRTAATPGDRLYVTGTIGDAALGLKLRLAETAGPKFSASAQAFLRRRYLLPEPRLALREAVRDHARAGMDVSDGFIGDLAKMMRVSGVSANVDLERVPLSVAVREAIQTTPALRDVALTGGDDYELLLAVPPSNVPAFEAAARRAHVTVTEVGVVLAGPSPPTFRDGDGVARTFDRPSFSHL